MNTSLYDEFRSADDADARRKALRSLRKTHGLTQKGLGALADIDHTTISRFERGDSDMSPAVHKQLDLTFETLRRMQDQIDKSADARKRHADFDEKAGFAAKALGLHDHLPPADPAELGDWRKRMYPVLKKRVDVDFTEMEGGGTVGEYIRFLREALVDAARRQREVEIERDQLQKDLLGLSQELIEAYRRISALENAAKQ